MPKRFFRYSRTEPVRTILITVAILTIVAQWTTLIPWVPGPWHSQILNIVIVTSLAGWALWAGVKKSARQMSYASFWLFMLWLWSGIMRLLFTPDPWLLLWVPFIVVAACLAISYLWLSYQRRTGEFA